MRGTPTPLPVNIWSPAVLYLPNQSSVRGEHYSNANGSVNTSRRSGSSFVIHLNSKRHVDPWICIYFELRLTSIFASRYLVSSTSTCDSHTSVRPPFRRCRICLQRLVCTKHKLPVRSGVQSDNGQCRLLLAQVEVVVVRKASCRETCNWWWRSTLRTSKVSTQYAAHHSTKLSGGGSRH